MWPLVSCKEPFALPVILEARHSGEGISPVGTGIQVWKSFETTNVGVTFLGGSPLPCRQVFPPPVVEWLWGRWSNAPWGGSELSQIKMFCLQGRLLSMFF
jgi:hypothetical protein